jgi:hypothetical protein
LLSKNKLLKFVAANIYLYDKQLTIKLSNTYEGLKEFDSLNTSVSSKYNWCNTLTRLLTSKATELEHDVAFAELVESLQLRGDLLAI